jgi:MFS family permease
MFCAPVFGYLADRYGRRNVNLYGIICIAISMSAMPYAPEYWIYVILRCIYATGINFIT